MTKIAAAANGKVLLVDEGDISFRLPLSSEVEIGEDAYVFHFDDVEAIDPSEVHGRAGIELAEKPLRESWNLITPEEYHAAVKAAELLNWHNSTRFCSFCGSRLKRDMEISKKCPECGREYFPSLFPAIVVLVTDGEKALLVHGKSLRKDVHALVAGFVETGESLEECVAREVKEEADLEITDIRYFGSQSWPFPHQLMIGFTAKLKKGTVRFADGELDSGGFFTRDNLPLLPSPPSLTRRLIDTWLSAKL